MTETRKAKVRVQRPSGAHRPGGFVVAKLRMSSADACIFLMVRKLVLFLILLSPAGAKANELPLQAELEASGLAPTKEQQLLKRMQDREDARGWKTFDETTYYAWKEWKIIAPDVRATTYKQQSPEVSFFGSTLPAMVISGKISVSCAKLAWRYWETPNSLRWGSPRQAGYWGRWTNAGSPESSLEKNAMVAALCASIRDR